MADDMDLKKASRAPRVPGQGRRPTITFRCRTDLQNALQQVAQNGDRSLSEEIERRLDQSLSYPDMARAAVDTAAKTVLSNNFGSREIFESAQLHGKILRGLIDILRVRAGDDRDWNELDEAKDYLKQELASRIDGMVDALFCDLDLKRLQGADAYEADALVSERRIPREIGGAYLRMRFKKNEIHQKLLPHLMDETAQDDTGKDKQE